MPALENKSAGRKEWLAAAGARAWYFLPLHLFVAEGWHD
jgi:hypothetical protein